MTQVDASKLARDVRLLKVYALAVTVELAVVALTGAKSPDGKVVTAERIDIVDPPGVARLVIATTERMPLPRLDGKEYPRAVSPAGTNFYDQQGNEVGGLAITAVATGKV